MTPIELNACPVFRPDHNGECLLCDEWLDAHTEAAVTLGQQVATALEVVAENQRLREQHARQALTIHEKTDAWREATEQVARLREELVKANEKVEAFRQSATDVASKLQFLINWADQQGLLEERVFCFPDGDIWEAKRGEN